MHGYIHRTDLVDALKSRLESNPAVALLGARQVGKSTLAEVLLKQFPGAIYLDLERPADINKLTDPEAFFTSVGQVLICLDEIQRLPDIFPVLRGLVDRNKRNAQFLLLGSASRDLIRQSSESLAGRLSYLEITPFTQAEVPAITPALHWLRGGYPRSVLADGDETSFQWREDYIRTFLERDIPQLGFQIPANTMARLWRMLAHSHGQVLNTSKLAASMGVSPHTIRKYIDLLEQTFMLRVLLPYTGNTKKRLIKSPKVYLRDSGILHALLGIENQQELFGHPVYGPSWEGYVIENIITQLPRWDASFFRTSNGAEMDLVLEKGLKRVAVEIKSSTNPVVSKGFWTSIETIQPDATYIVAPVDSTYPIEERVTVMPLPVFIREVKKDRLSS
ncbi:AAA ATPase [hydrothermal vent metagenome]|uniref:AAA ATPase n=1 Tax=hydrothermal vent metagenome TaxID=652676 RepID=A0A3B0YMH1_9ZZZZ